MIDPKPLPSKRIKEKTEDLRNLYIVPCFPRIEGEPEFMDLDDLYCACEVWITLPDENKHEVQPFRNLIRVLFALYRLARKPEIVTTQDIIEAVEWARCCPNKAIDFFISVMKKHCWRENLYKKLNEKGYRFDENGELDTEDTTWAVVQGVELEGADADTDEG